MIHKLQFLLKQPQNNIIILFIYYYILSYVRLWTYMYYLNAFCKLLIYVLLFCCFEKNKNEMKKKKNSNDVVRSTRLPRWSSFSNNSSVD